MRSFFSSLSLSLVCAATALVALPADAQPVQSLIIKLKPLAQQVQTSSQTIAQSSKSAGRESAQARSENHERISALSRSSGVVVATHRSLGLEHQLLVLNKTVQGQDLEDTMRRLRLDPQIESVEPNVRLRLQETTPNDTNFAQQWHLGSSQVNASALNLPTAWDRTTGSSQVVAVLDTGILPHPDLAGKVLPGYDFVTNEVVGTVSTANDGNGRDSDPSDPGDWVTEQEAKAFGAKCTEQPESSWHGTFIAGQIAAASNNGQGVAGVNWGAQILPVRVSGKCGALLSDVLDGMRWSAGLHVDGVPDNTRHARIINLSFRGDVPCSSSYQTVIDEVTAAGSLLVVAAGNTPGDKGSLQLKRPADCRGVMAVGAVDAQGAKTSYSFIGSNMALMAPGGTDGVNAPLLSTSNSGVTSPEVAIYGYKQGTSFAAPLAAGVASLMLAINPSLTPQALIARMRAAARPHTFTSGLSQCTGATQFTGACNCTTNECGAGLLDAGQSVLLAYAPSAVIRLIGTPSAGTDIMLDGSAGAAVQGASVARYQWSVVSGAVASLQNTNSPVLKLKLALSTQQYVLKLQVTDSLGAVGEDTIAFASTPPVDSGGGASPWLWGVGLWLLLIALGVQKYKEVATSPGIYCVSSYK
jgi:serine protease